MKTTIQYLAVLASAFVLSNCTTYVDPGVSATPTVTGTSTTTHSIASPYTGDSVTTKKTTTTYQ